MIIKICGLKRAEDLKAAIELGADYAGMIVGVPESPRSQSVEEAKKLFEISSGTSTKRALLFRSSPIEDVLEALEELSPDVVHLCGSEDRVFRSKLRDKFPDVIQWQSVGVPVDLPEEKSWVERVHDLLEEPEVQKVVLDSAKSGKTGGVGQAFPTEMVRRELGAKVHELILAGGLNPENVLDRIQELRPAGVDVSSGLESQPGEKSLAKMKLFVERVRNSA